MNQKINYTIEEKLAYYEDKIVAALGQLLAGNYADQTEKLEILHNVEKYCKRVRELNVDKITKDWRDTNHDNSKK